MASVSDLRKNATDSRRIRGKNASLNVLSARIAAIVETQELKSQ
jgi:hypothetical protein